MAGSTWQDFVPNTEVLTVCNVNAIETILLSAQFHRSGHLVRMEDERIPKAMFYGEIKEVVCLKGGPRNGSRTV